MSGLTHVNYFIVSQSHAISSLYKDQGKDMKKLRQVTSSDVINSSILDPLS